MVAHTSLARLCRPSRISSLQEIADMDGVVRLLLCLHDADEQLQRNAAAAVRELARCSPAAAQKLLQRGAVGPVIDAVVTVKGAAKLPGE